MNVRGGGDVEVSFRMNLRDQFGVCESLGAQVVDVEAGPRIVVLGDSHISVPLFHRLETSVRVQHVASGGVEAANEHEVSLFGVEHIDITWTSSPLVESRKIQDKWLFHRRIEDLHTPVLAVSDEESFTLGVEVDSVVSGKLSRCLPIPTPAVAGVFPGVGVNSVHKVSFATTVSVHGVGESVCSGSVGNREGQTLGSSDAMALLSALINDPESFSDIVGCEDQSFSVRGLNQAHAVAVFHVGVGLENV